MEKNVLYWIVGIVVVAAVFFNMGDLTGNAVNTKPDTRVTSTNSPLRSGSQLQVNVIDAETLTQEFKVYDEDDKYTGRRFFARSSRCGPRKDTQTYDCNLEFRTTSMKPGTYYIKSKTRKGILSEKQAPFEVI